MDEGIGRLILDNGARGIDRQIGYMGIRIKWEDII